MDQTQEDQDLRQAIADLKITVPIYHVEPTASGLRLYLYGHSEPVDWIRPSSKEEVARNKSQKPPSRKGPPRARG